MSMSARKNSWTWFLISQEVVNTSHFDLILRVAIKFIALCLKESVQEMYEQTKYEIQTKIEDNVTHASKTTMSIKNTKIENLPVISFNT